MAYSTILLEKSNNIYTLTLNRPEVLNALNEQMRQDFFHAFDVIAKDSEARVLVITGAGKSFSSGVDLKASATETQPIPGQESEWLSGFPSRGFLGIHNLRVPTIASVNGAAIGFGLALSLACDIRIAGDDAKFNIGFVNIGVVPGFGLTYLLPRLIGIAKACEIALTGKMIDANEAKEMGLVNHVVPATELKSATESLAQSLAEKPPVAVKLTKQALYQGLDNSLINHLSFQDLLMSASARTEDYDEAKRAFSEKRRPVFKGQ